MTQLRFFWDVVRTWAWELSLLFRPARRAVVRRLPEQCN